MRNKTASRYAVHFLVVILASVSTHAVPLTFFALLWSYRYILTAALLLSFGGCASTKTFVDPPSEKLSHDKARIHLRRSADVGLAVSLYVIVSSEKMEPNGWLLRAPQPIVTSWGGVRHDIFYFEAPGGIVADNRHGLFEIVEKDNRIHTITQLRVNPATASIAAGHIAEARKEGSAIRVIYANGVDNEGKLIQGDRVTVVGKLAPGGSLTWDNPPGSIRIETVVYG